MAHVGWIYACCAGSNLACVKIGMTTQACPELYCHNSYSRSMLPLSVLRTQSVPFEHTGLAEKTVFAALHRFRIEGSRECFNIPSIEVLETAFDAMHEAFGVLARSDDSCTIVDVVPVPMADFTGASQRTQRAVRRLVDAIMARVKAAARRIDADAAEALKEASRQATRDRLEAFVRERCDVAPAHRVSTTALLTAFNLVGSGGNLTNAETLSAHMRQLGFHKKSARFGSRTASAYPGVKLKGTGSNWPLL